MMQRLLFALLSVVMATAAARAQQEPTDEAPLPLPEAWSTYYVLLLKEGPRYNEKQPVDSVRALMGRHIQYQLRLQASRRAVAAGGFAKPLEGAIGMTLLRAESLEEATQIAEADPAVAAGRFTAVVAAWYVPAGRIPEE